MLNTGNIRKLSTVAMALVAYGSDISDSEDEEIPTKTEINKTASTKLVLPIPKESVESDNNVVEGLFNILPKPKNDKWAPDVPEEEDEFLLKKAVPIDELPPKAIYPKKLSERKPAKIMLPSLSSFENDEEGETQTKFKTSVKGTGLLSMLPQPKTSPQVLGAQSSTKFVPHILTKPIVKPVKPVIPKKTKVLEISYESSEESDASDTDAKEKDIDFFSLNKKEEIIPTPTPINNFDQPQYTNVRYTEPEAVCTDIDYNVESYADDVPIDYNVESYADVPTNDVVEYSHIAEEPIQEPPAQIDAEAMRILCGSSKRRKGEPPMQFIDIDQKEILPDSKEWLTKALTENSTTKISSSKRKGDGPSTQSRRKHQITYLAHQARANEQELQNQWANNRMTRKQTQSKYGF